VDLDASPKERLPHRAGKCPTARILTEKSLPPWTCEGAEMATLRGQDTPGDATIRQNVSYWPHLSTISDYIRRSILRDARTLTSGRV